MAYLYKCKKAIKVYDEIGESLLECKEKGYSVASPVKEEMKLLAPTILKQNGNYGVKLEAIAPSIHLIKVDVNSTFTPMVGSAKESENIIEGLVNKDNNDEVWNQEFFGRKLADILNDSMKKTRFVEFPINQRIRLKKYSK
ncbi:MAG: stage IV sporulation protein A [Clostridium sp.]|nr:MAG: stage IV sporulation protein A [Clostridium sp.]